ncbi:V-set and immunoglobulin domain-containing protein 1-like [Heterodontus francisci]|uniref:V-set and immunoglobulin domain-containing protein 1-like n=1 Tax=Heterodontus francisci TaxID=7792 RepID=UPI00355C2CD7
MKGFDKNKLFSVAEGSIPRGDRIKLIGKETRGYVLAVEVTVKDSQLNATEGGNVTLQCMYTTTQVDISNLNIQWTFLRSLSTDHIQQTSCPTGYNVDESSVMHCPKTVHMLDRRGLCSWQFKIYYSEGKQTYINQDFKGRLLAAHNPGNASITIEKLRPSDTGSYLCEVDNPPDFTGTNIGSIMLTVLVAPSKPKCGVTPHPAKAMTAILTCHSDEGVPAPTYHWVKIVNNVHQTISGYFDPRTGILTVSNISEHENGVYLCTASNNLGNQSCTVDLSILSSESDYIIGGIIGAILVAMVIGAIIWAATKKRKKNVEKDTEFQVKHEARKTSTTYVAVPTDHAPAASANANDVELPEAAQSSMEASDVHRPPTEAPLLSENPVSSGTEKAAKEETEGDGPQTT